MADGGAPHGALPQLSGELAQRGQIAEAEERIGAALERRLDQAALLQVAEVVEAQRRIHDQDVLLAVVVSGALGHGRPKRRCVRRIEGQFRHRSTSRYNRTPRAGDKNSRSSWGRRKRRRGERDLVGKRRHFQAAAHGGRRSGRPHCVDPEVAAR